MKIALVIFTCNAVRRGLWPRVLTAVQAQQLPLDLKLVVDSSSQDETVSFALQEHWVVWRHHRKNFNHGRTRQRVLQILRRRQFDVVIFLSQDVVLLTPDALTNLVDFLCRNQLVGVYGRQSGGPDHRSFDAWQRSRCYPAISQICRSTDLPRPQAFFSDAFAAWNINAALAHGGFPSTEFAEDVLLVTKVLRHGGSVGYCAEAQCFHLHADSRRELFCRGRQVGRFHAAYSELLRQFLLVPPGIGMVPWRFWVAAFSKLVGYCWGRYCSK